jgi:hypothetical protein
MNFPKPLAIAALSLAMQAPAQAVYTECSVTKDTSIVNRPNGNADPRWSSLKKGDKVAIRDIYQDWRFVFFRDLGENQYGWLPKSVLINCERQEGTP